jgi:hypothetical protein
MKLKGKHTKGRIDQDGSNRSGRFHTEGMKNMEVN